MCANISVISVQALASFSVVGIGSRTLNMLDMCFSTDPWSIFGTVLLIGFSEHLNYVNLSGNESVCIDTYLWVEDDSGGEIQ